MQVVIGLPCAREIHRLDASVCGVPVLARVIATALRSGGSRVLVVMPPGWSHDWLVPRLKPGPIDATCIETVDIGRVFDPNEAEDWRAIEHCLDDRFLWMPPDYLVHKRALADLLESARHSPGASFRFCAADDAGQEPSPFEGPCVLLKHEQLSGARPRFRGVVKGQVGISVRPPASIGEVEAELVRQSGKVTDGVYSRFNRMLCRPAVRWLSHTRVTPNLVTFVGLVVAVLSGLCFAHGSWVWGVAGAALFFISGLFDEIDGMLARLKFQESPFGCWLETMVDYATYLLVFAGMTVGGYSQGGMLYLVLGLTVLIGLVLSFIVISIQRKLAAPPDRPNEYSRLYLAALERDRANLISRLVRQLQFLTKKGVLVHYLLLFAVLNLLPVVLFIAAFGANVAWIVTVYLNRRLFLTSKRRANRRLVARHAVPAEVEK
ncbi:MAG: CDP-alcohol phosphatidyltransferase family protein [Acidobacteriota bacterium]